MTCPPTKRNRGNDYSPNLKCPLNIDECAKQITSYPEGQEKIWCCDDNCTNPTGQQKTIENREAKVIQGAKLK